MEFYISVVSFMFNLQVKIGTVCFTCYAFTLDYGRPFDCKAVPYITAASLFIVMLLAFTLDYGGPFDCKAVPYITAASLFIVMLLAVVITVFYKHRRRRLLNDRSKKRDPGRFRITPQIAQRGSPIRSRYPLMPYPTVSVHSFQ